MPPEPEAEARAIYQLLDEEAFRQIGNLYRDVGRGYILAFAIMAVTIAAVPRPFTTMVNLRAQPGDLHGHALSGAIEQGNCRDQI